MAARNVRDKILAVIHAELKPFKLEGVEQRNKKDWCGEDIIIHVQKQKAIGTLFRVGLCFKTNDLIACVVFSGGKIEHGNMYARSADDKNFPDFAYQDSDGMDQILQAIRNACKSVTKS